MPEIQMPKLSDTMTEGTLVAWKKKKGDRVSAGEVLAEIYVEEGGKVNVGDKIAFIGGEGEEAPKQEAPAQKEEKQPKPAEQKEKQPEAETEKPAPAEAKQKESAPPQQEKTAEPSVSSARKDGKSEEARVKASPVARRIAAELGVDLSSVKGTGPEGRITETDVRGAAKSVKAGVSRAQKQPARLPLQTNESARIQLSGMRKIIAQRLVESLGPVPHFYLQIDVNAGPLMEAREELKSAGEGADAAKITVNDFVLKSAVQAAVKVPRVNASFDRDAFVQYADIDLGIAVAIEDGLLTPVIRAAQNKSLREISELAKDLAHRARNKRMKPEEFQGGTFTVSNLGGMGIDSFSAIINPPQGFILA